MIAFYTPSTLCSSNDLNVGTRTTSYTTDIFDKPLTINVIKYETQKVVIKDTKSMLKVIKQKEKLRNDSLKKFKDRY